MDCVLSFLIIYMKYLPLDNETYSVDSFFYLFSFLIICMNYLQLVSRTYKVDSLSISRLLKYINKIFAAGQVDSVYLYASFIVIYMKYLALDGKNTKSINQIRSLYNKFNINVG